MLTIHALKVTLLGAGIAAIAAGFATPAAAKPAACAYATFQNGDFGVINLTTGAFTRRGNSGTLVGLAVTPAGTLVSELQGSGQLYSVNPANGALTYIGQTGLTTSLDIGSTLTTVYEVTGDGSVYTIDTGNGKALKLGNAGVAISNNNSIGFSAGAKSLFTVNNYEVNTINLANGKFRAIRASPLRFGALAYVNRTLYAGTFDDSGTLAIYKLSYQNGAVFVANLQGETTGFFGLVPAPSSSC